MARKKQAPARPLTPLYGGLDPRIRDAVQQARESPAAIARRLATEELIEAARASERLTSADMATYVGPVD